MSTVASGALLIVLPLLSAVSLVLAVVRQRTRPAWLFALALVAPLATVTFAAWATAAYGRSLVYPVAAAWMLTATAALVLAMIGTRRGWRASQSLTLLGAIMPSVALVPLLPYAGLLLLGSGGMN